MAVAVGFIALVGVAAAMLIHLDHALEARPTLAASAGLDMNRGDIHAIMEGCD